MKFQRACPPRFAGGQEPGFRRATAQPVLFMMEDQQALDYADVKQSLGVAFTFDQVMSGFMVFRMYIERNAEAY